MIDSSLIIYITAALVLANTINNLIDATIMTFLARRRNKQNKQVLDSLLSSLEKAREEDRVKVTPVAKKATVKKKLTPTP